MTRRNTFIGMPWWMQSRVREEDPREPFSFDRFGGILFSSLSPFFLFALSFAFPPSFSHLHHIDTECTRTARIWRGECFCFVAFLPPLLPAHGCHSQVLELPNVSEMRQSDDVHEKQLWSLLHLFAYDTYGIYARNKALYGELTAAQERKLKQLSIVSLAARQHRIAYDELKDELGIYDVRELEDLLLDTIYLGWIAGKLDAKEEAIHIDFAISRDTKESDLLHIQAVLESWCGRAETLMRVIDEKVDILRGEIQRNTMERKQFEERVRVLSDEVAAMQLQKQEHGEGRHHGHDRMGMMMMDEGGLPRRSAKSSRRRP